MQKVLLEVIFPCYRLEYLLHVNHSLVVQYANSEVIGSIPRGLSFRFLSQWCLNKIHWWILDRDKRRNIMRICSEYIEWNKGQVLRGGTFGLKNEGNTRKTVNCISVVRTPESKFHRIDSPPPSIPPNHIFSFSSQILWKFHASFKTKSVHAYKCYWSLEDRWKCFAIVRDFCAQPIVCKVVFFLYLQ